MNDHASSSSQASMKKNERDWVREKFGETKIEILKIRENNKRMMQAMEDMRMMMAKKEKK